MKVRALKDFDGIGGKWHVGNEVEIQDGLAEQYLTAGVVEVVTDSPVEAEAVEEKPKKTRAKKAKAEEVAQPEAV